MYKHVGAFNCQLFVPRLKPSQSLDIVWNDRLNCLCEMYLMYMYLASDKTQNYLFSTVCCIRKSYKLGFFVSTDWYQYYWGEPERAPHKRYSCVRIVYILFYGTCTSVMPNICPAWLYGHKREIFYCAFSFLGHRPYVRCSNLANCRFTLVLFNYHHRGMNVEPSVNQSKVRKTELVISHSQLNSVRSG